VINSEFCSARFIEMDTEISVFFSMIGFE